MSTDNHLHDEIVCRQITVLDSKGLPRIVLSTLLNDLPCIQINDENCLTKMTLMINEDGSPIVALHKDSAEPFISFGMDAAGDVGFRISPIDSNASMYLMTYANRTFRVSLAEQGKEMVLWESHRASTPSDEMNRGGQNG